MKIELYGGEMIFSQDCDMKQGGIQQINISAQDYGAGKFFRIKTDDWSFDKIEDLVALLEKVYKAFDMEKGI